MAEYYPLISRAVAGLRSGPPEARQAIYDRARQALVGQLRAMDPPVPEEAISRETAALDEAIARTEADIPLAADVVPASPKTEPTVRVPRPPARLAETSVVPARPASAAPSLGGATRDDNARPELPNERPRPPAPLLRTTTRTVPSAAPGESLRPEPVASRGDAEPPQPEVSPQDPTPGPVFPAAAALRVGSAEHETSLPDIATASEVEQPPRATPVDKARDDIVRPAAPRPSEKRRPNLRVWIVAVAALAAVVTIAFTAWRLRDNPQQLARTLPAQTAPAAADKIAERADGSETAGNSSAPAASVASDEATRTATEPAASAGPTASPAFSSPSGPDSANPPTPTVRPSAAVAQPASNQADPTIPIAYKAAILVDAPDLPEKVKTYIGTVVWSVQNVAQGQGQPLGTAIQADINIPDANTQLVMQIRRNTEAQLPASHTIDLRFTLAAGGPLGSIKQINVPQMRQQDQPTGDPLAGIPVTIADNYFLIGLMRGSAEERNLDLLGSRNWMDIPLLLANGKASKITFEKGSAGERVFADVLNSWKTSQN